MGDVVRLNIGGGETEMDGYTTIDRKNGKEAFPLDYADGTVDEIRASHILEHFGFKEVPEVLTDWVRTLKPGGRLRLAVPDFDWIADRYLRSEQPSSLLFAYAMGGQSDADDFHKSAYDVATLRSLMERVGLRNIKEWKSDANDCAMLPVSLNLEGVRPPRREPKDIPKTTAIMSTARLGFTENIFCAAGTFQPRNIPIIKYTGAYWGQGMERVIQEALDNGSEWIVTLDYDTVFNGTVFDRLCYEFADHPEVDALAPWQVKRESSEVLVWMTDENGNKRTNVRMDELEPDVTQVATAHFGLTLLRASAFKDLPRPWFWAQPNKDNTWGEGRVDDDIYFWKNWEKAGRTLYMANHVSIGHLQQVVTWPSQDLRSHHQYLSDFQKQGPPETARR